MTNLVGGPQTENQEHSTEQEEQHEGLDTAIMRSKCQVPYLHLLDTRHLHEFEIKGEI